VVDLELESRLKGLTEMLPSIIRVQVSVGWGRRNRHSKCVFRVACCYVSNRLTFMMQASAVLHWPNNLMIR
jgi:hypothetical protein